MEIKTQLVEEIDGKPVTKITLVNDQGVSASVLTLGATWQEFLVPTSSGEPKNLILGFDKPSDYFTNSLCAGQSIGRVAGRIDAGRFRLNGHDYQVPQNEKGNCLHGGPQGFHKQNWDYRLEETSDAVNVILTYSAKGEVDGFPGDMKIETKFTLDNANRFAITYTGKDTSQSTLFNPTNHVYFNLGERQDLTHHSFHLLSHQYLETRDDLVPTGKFLDVAGTAYDFRKGQNLGAAIAQIGGFDDAFVVEPSLVEPVGLLKDEESGDQLKLYSDRNAWVVYTMGGLPGGIYPARDKGQEAKEFEAVALEAQFLPDAINHDDFGDITLEPNTTKTYHIAFEYSKAE
jgi:aldose 1-epimerase